MNSSASSSACTALTLCLPEAQLYSGPYGVGFSAFREIRGASYSTIRRAHQIP